MVIATVLVQKQKNNFFQQHIIFILVEYKALRND